jgi:hypothetical protein
VTRWLSEQISSYTLKPSEICTFARLISKPEFLDRARRLQGHVADDAIHANSPSIASGGQQALPAATIEIGYHGRTKSCGDDNDQRQVRSA